MQELQYWEATDHYASMKPQLPPFALAVDREMLSGENVSPYPGFIPGLRGANPSLPRAEEQFLKAVGEQPEICTAAHPAYVALGV